MEKNLHHKMPMGGKPGKAANIDDGKHREHSAYLSANKHTGMHKPSLRGKTRGGKLIQ